MDRLIIHSRYVDERNEIIIVAFKGESDHTNFGEIEKFLQPFLEKGQPKFICDLSQLTVITESVIGYFIGLAKYIRLHQGDIVLTGISNNFDHLKKFIKGSQLLAYFDVEEEAMEHFLYTKHAAGHYHFKIILEKENIVSGVPFKGRIEVVDPLGDIMEAYSGITHIIVDKGLVYPSLIKEFENGIWEGEMIVSHPGNVKMRVWDDKGVGVINVYTKEEGENVEFPINVVCPGCKVSNVAGKTDVFRCVHCNEIYFVDKYGHVIPLRPGETSGEGIVKRLEFTMPSDVNYLNHVRNFIVGVSAEEKIDDEKIAQIEMSLDEALANVIEHAYSYDAYQQISISVTLYRDQLEIVLRDQGRSFDSQNTPLPDLKKHIEERRVGGLGRYLMKTLMDDVEYKSDGHTNELRMVKKF